MKGEAMNADDISDFLRAVKEAEEIGLTPAEVWRTEECGNGFWTGPLSLDWRKCELAKGHDYTHAVHTRQDLERCARCKRETAPENGYRTGAGFFCSVCSSEYNDSSVR
jgi:hypothetical protein